MDAYLRVREWGQPEYRTIVFTDTGKGPEDWCPVLARAETKRIRHITDYRDSAVRHVVRCANVAPATYHVQTGYTLADNQTIVDGLLIVNVYTDAS